jgi:UDP-galactose transporter B1
MQYELAEEGSHLSKSTESDDVVPLLPSAEGSPGSGAKASPPSSSNGLPPTAPPPDSPGAARAQAARLLFGAGGIYASFLYYGSLQEDVFRYQSEADGGKFTMAWYLQVLESLANVAFGTAALVIMGLTGSGYDTKEGAGDGRRRWWGGAPNLPKRPFLLSGLSQVCSKAFTSLALANGLSFPVATLAKSGKMAPVMIGSLILGGASYG